MLFYKLFSSILFDFAVLRRVETTYWLWLYIPYILMPYIFASWWLGIFLRKKPIYLIFCDLSSIGGC